MNRRSLATITVTIGASLSPLLALAATSAASSTPLFHNINDVVAKACQVVNILFTGAILLTIVFVLLAAFKYITKGSDPKAVSDAHQMLIWAAIGFAVALCAAVVPGFIAGALGTGIGNAC